jgi:FtsP/CotA-like multicopper oxidase with cupredoxin domain
MWRNLSSRYKANTEAHVRMTTGAENQVTELSEEEVSKLFDEGAKFVTADALGRWAYHCHLLLHMEMGMFREVRVDE